MKNLVIILIFLSLFSCNNMKEFNGIKNANSVTLHLLDSKISNTTENKKLISGRKIIKSLEIKGENRTKLSHIFLDNSNYEKASRKCKLEPVYALEIDKKIVALFDIKYCPRIEFTKDTTKVSYDIVFNNSYIDFFKSIDFLTD